MKLSGHTVITIALILLGFIAFGRLFGWLPVVSIELVALLLLAGLITDVDKGREIYRVVVVFGAIAGWSIGSRLPTSSDAERFIAQIMLAVVGAVAIALLNKKRLFTHYSFSSTFFAFAYSVVVVALTGDFFAGLLALAIVRGHVLTDWLKYHVFREKQKQAIETAKLLLVFSILSALLVVVNAFSMDAFELVPVFLGVAALSFCLLSVCVDIKSEK
ncbi:MAG: hypothetical protein V1811_00185 [Candidatus Micrarchaeota archaeon]